MAGAPGFSLEPDGKISFDAPQGFLVHVDLLWIGDGCIERIHTAEPFFEGSVASMSDLLRLRAVTVVDRGDDGDTLDFLWLLAEVARAGQALPVLDTEELQWMMGAAVPLSTLDRWILAAILGVSNHPTAMRLLS